MSNKYYAIFCASNTVGYYDGYFYGIYYDRDKAVSELLKHAQDTMAYHEVETPELRFFQEMEEDSNGLTIHVFSEPKCDESDWNYLWTLRERSTDDHSPEEILSL